MKKTLLLSLLFILFPVLARGATCSAGYYLDNGTCVECLDNHYCVGDDIMRECPAVLYTEDEVIQLLANNGYEALSFDRAYLSTRWDRDARYVTSILHCGMAVLTVQVPQGRIRVVYFRYNEQSKNYTSYGWEYWDLANSGYYLSGYYTADLWSRTKPCTNTIPANSHYSGPGTPDSADGTIVDANDCPWECDIGYGRTANDTCEPLCTAGITRLRTSTGLIYNLYANQLTSPAIHIKQNGITCYTNLTPGGATDAINIRNNGTVYHATN